MTKDNNNSTNPRCPICGSDQFGIHEGDCPRAIKEWRQWMYWANGMPMPERNARALMELHAVMCSYGRY